MLKCFFIDKALQRSEEITKIVKFVETRNPELSLFITDDLSDHAYSQVQGYFKKVEKKVSN